MNQQSTPKEKKEEVREKTLEHLLSECGTGWKIQIKRTSPEWCDGILGTEDVEPDTPISTEEIRSRFGGRKLSIKILDHMSKYVGKVSLKFPDPPRKDGAEIEHPDVKRKRELAALESPQGQQWSIKDALELAGKMFSNSQNNGGGSDYYEKLLGLQRENMQQQIALMEARLNIKNPLPPDHKDALSPVREAAHTFKEIENMRKMLGLDQQSESNSEYSLVEKAMEEFMGLEVEKQKMKLQFMYEQQRQEAQKPQTQDQRPPIPDREERQKPDNDQAAAFSGGLPADINQVPDAILGKIAKQQLAALDPETRDGLLAVMSGEAALEEEADEPDPDQSTNTDVQSSEDNENELEPVDRGRVEMTTEDANKLARESAPSKQS